MSHKLTTNIEKFVFGGKSRFTVVNEKTGNRFTYRIKGMKDNENLHFVSLLTGSDNETSYSFFGSIFNRETYKFSTKKSKIGCESQGVKVFDWFVKSLKSNTLPDFVSVYHEGKCGRCGRTLTVPESIVSGFGPECIGKI